MKIMFARKKHAILFIVWAGARWHVANNYLVRYRTSICAKHIELLFKVRDLYSQFSLFAPRPLLYLICDQTFFPHSLFF